jgi:predicted DNA repair protein MutK
VTPRYVTGFSAARELPIIRRIELGSLKNKLIPPPAYRVSPLWRLARSRLRSAKP